MLIPLIWLCSRTNREFAHRTVHKWTIALHECGLIPNEADSSRGEFYVRKYMSSCSLPSSYDID